MNIRSLERRANHCTCPDFATNQLGTCKHIEAVLHQVRKHRDFGKLKDRPPPTSYVFLDWEAEHAPALRLHRGAEIEENLSRLLNDHFDATGAFVRRLPEDFLRFADAVAGRAEIDLGEDATGFARRLAENAAHRLRAREIGERIRALGSRLPGVNTRLYPLLGRRRGLSHRQRPGTAGRRHGPGQDPVGYRGCGLAARAGRGGAGAGGLSGLP